MNSQFRPDPSKLNPKFESYKLSAFPESKLFRTSLTLQPFRQSNDRRIGFRDLQARIRLSSLFYGYPLDKNRGSAFFIDQNFHLYMIVFNNLTKETSIHLISELIQPIGPIPSFTEPDSSVPLDLQLPSVIALGRDLLLVSNGVGDIELIGIEETQLGQFVGASLATVAYPGTGDEGISPVPCVLLTGQRTAATITFLVYSRANAKQKTEFNIAMMEMDLPNTNDDTIVIHPRVLFILRGSEVPVYYSITPNGRLVLGSETRFQRISLSEVEDQEEMMDIDRKPVTSPAYQWSQEGPDMTVMFKLPSGTPKSSINCKFVKDHLSLLVNEQISYPYRKLWSTIRPDDCLWTLEDDTLTLFLTKEDERTRWPQLFDHDDGILETLTPLRLEEIKQHMNKFTQDPNEGIPTGMAPPPPPPSQHPAATDMDEDIDEEGHPVLFTVYSRDGQVKDEIENRSNWLCSAFTSSSHMTSVCLQSDVDGLVFSLREEEGKLEVQHETTLDAFAFVQASKRDARFIHHDPNGEFSAIIESNRNAYLYYHAGRAFIKKQSLIDLTRGEGDVLGVQLILSGTIMVLTETEVIVILTL
ncbi:uncharacterized protein BX663DRAFT_443818 [Cokeromyces recurvatus]|uniref:uncharacterized protein n=1 Tax=Cokeromyces recurvatus TaxID=90255 RepID=UPI00221F699C|nr:uncharacterized protein BX663DRAFT_443818 [Cokeromyces recurvatus]KAI7898099.1 hypothetical protein BX663DRAFT_443818 [Cokeromyces recurvatus]